jgi:ferredoxin
MDLSEPVSTVSLTPMWAWHRFGAGLRERGMRIAVDVDLCESNAICAGIAPDVFDLGADDTVQVLREAPEEADRQRVEEAVRRCPKQAISVLE